MDRHPELKSRAVAWTPYDGSFLIDTQSRAEVLDFYWTVLRAPYPSIGWTGSLASQDPGTTSEAWRVREYSQLNAYRALAGLNAIDEDPTLLPAQQKGALVMALNQRVEHRIDTSWIGYNDEARAALASSNLWAPTGMVRPPEDGFTDGFVHDAYSTDPIFVGHRKDLLEWKLEKTAIGSALTVSSFETVAWTAFTVTRPSIRSTPTGAYVAWPPSGVVPKALIRARPSDPTNTAPFRWSFQLPWEGWPGADFTKVTITARSANRAVPIIDLQKHPYNAQWTWCFAASDVDFNQPDDQKIEITVSGVAVPNKPSSYQYSVLLTDEQTIIPTSFSPKSDLVNLSTRGTAGGKGGELIVGFYIGGTLPVRVALRVQGPSLSRYGLSGTAMKPKLTLFDGQGSSLGENRSWKDHAHWRLVQSLGLAPQANDEPAMVATLWPGAYTAVVSDEGGDGGVAIVEAFNIDNLSTSRLVNVSTRGFVGRNGEQLIAGFTIKDHLRTVVIRTQGPTLSRYGITGVVDDTRLTVTAQNDGHIVATNDDWSTDSQSQRLRSDLAAYAPANPREAALVLTLAPGAYSAVVDAIGSTGTGIVEVFEILP